nr:hypothetical protein Iba_chr03aCG12990 [Ipomoea batatas]
MASAILSDKSTMPYCPELCEKLEHLVRLPPTCCCVCWFKCFCCGVWTADCGLGERGERPCDCRSESVAVADWRQRRRNG